MNKPIVVYVLVMGVVWTARFVLAQSDFLYTTHRFYGDGYQAVACDIPAERVSERAVPPECLNEQGGLDVLGKFVRPLASRSETVRKSMSFLFAPADQSPWSIEALHASIVFWRQRSFETAWSLERHFYENQFDSFTNTLHWIQSDFDTISRDRHGFVLFGTYAECILMSLIRLQEENAPQRGWLSTRRLDSLFATRTRYQQHKWPKRWATVMAMILVSNRLAEYEQVNGMLPRSLEEAGVPGDWRSDAWGCPLSYTQTDERWFLLSLGEEGIADDQSKGGPVDINNNYPFFQYASTRNLVLYSGLMKRQSEYYRTGKLEMGRFSFARDPKTGVPRITSFLPARIVEEEE